MTTTQKKDVQKKATMMADDQQNTQASVPVPAAAVIKSQPKMKPHRLKSSEFTVLTYHAVADAGTTLEQIQDKTYFTHVANQLKPGNEIKVETEDGSLWAWLLVRAVVGTDVITETLLVKHFDPIEQGSIDVGEYQIAWGGSVDRWRVMRKADNYKVSSGHATKLVALSWLTEHQKALAA